MPKRFLVKWNQAQYPLVPQIDLPGPIQWVRVLRVLRATPQPSFAPVTNGPYFLPSSSNLFGGAFWLFDESNLVEPITGLDCRVAPAGKPFHRLRVTGRLVEFETGAPGEPFPGPAPQVSGGLEYIDSGSVTTGASPVMSPWEQTGEYQSLRILLWNDGSNSCTVNALEPITYGIMPTWTLATATVNAGQTQALEFRVDSDVGVPFELGLQFTENTGPTTMIWYMWGRR